MTTPPSVQKVETARVQGLLGISGLRFQDTIQNAAHSQVPESGDSKLKAGTDDEHLAWDMIRSQEWNKIPMYVFVGILGRGPGTQEEIQSFYKRVPKSSE